MLPLAVVVAEAAAPELPFPPVVFALIAAIVFVVLAFVMWSYRDVANRHSHKTNGPTAHGSDHH